MNRITILLSSTEKNAELAAQIEKRALEKGFEVDMVNLVELDLPLYSNASSEGTIPQNAKKLFSRIEASSSLIVISPEYNGLIAPTLINAITWVSIANKDWRKAFNGKPTLIATHSGGHGVRALVAMRIQLSYIGANVLGREISTSNAKSLNLESLDACLDQLA